MSKQIIECVPNISEGRDADKIRIISQIVEEIDGVKLLNVDPGKATNRTVITFVGEPQAVIDSAFLLIQKAQELIAHTHKIADMNPADFDGVFYPGGHGPLWDLANDKHSIAVIESFYKLDKPISFVCHAPAALRAVKGQDGEPIVKGKKVTGFTT